MAGTCGVAGICGGQGHQAQAWDDLESVCRDEGGQGRRRGRKQPTAWAEAQRGELQGKALQGLLGLS